MDGVPNMTLPLVVTATVVNHSVSKILIDDGSSYVIMYFSIFDKLGLWERNLMPYEVGDLLNFNKSSTHPFKTVELPIFVRERSD